MDIEQQIEQLKNALREVMALIVQRSQPLSDELKSALAQVMDHVARRIQELRAQESPAERLAHPMLELEPGPYPSSNVNSFKYDPKSEELLVKFHGQDEAAAGPTYKYSDVPKYIYDVFSKGAIGPKTSGQNRYHRWIKGVTPSLGGTLNALIKAGGFPYARVA